MSDTDLLAAMEAQIERLIRERDHANMTCDAAADKIEALQTRVNELERENAKLKGLLKEDVFSGPDAPTPLRKDGE